MTSDPTAPAPRRRRWPTALLAISLTLNLLVLGVVAGAHFRDDRDARRAPPPDRREMREGGYLPFFDAMPRDARKRMTEALRAQGAGLGPDRAALAADFRDLLVALRNEPFDAGELSAVLEAQNDRVAARIAQGRGVLVAQISEMSPGERAAFADALEHRFRDAIRRGPDGREGH